MIHMPNANTEAHNVAAHNGCATNLTITKTSNRIVMLTEKKKYDKEKDCHTCQGTGRQVFHGHFHSYRDTCNFCGGHGTREEELKWWDESFTKRGLGSRA